MPMPTLRIYIHWYIRNNERRTLSYRAIGYEFARFKGTADKTSVQRLSIMSVKRVICVWQGKETKKYWNGARWEEKFGKNVIL